MEGKTRRTGIEIVGDIPWGTHFCQFYQTREDLIDIMVPYFKAGLENNEFCMWVTSEPLDIDDAKESLRKATRNLDDYIERDQIRILDAIQWYIRSGEFDPDAVLQNWIRIEKEAVERGFDGLRLAGNTFWLREKDWRKFVDYEAMANKMISSSRMIAICSYHLDKCSAIEVIDVVSNHQLALIKRRGRWEIIESSERKRVEEALRESEEKYRLVVENANEAIVVVQDGMIKFVNPKTTEISGYSEEELTSRPFPEFIHLDDREMVIERHLKRLKGDRIPHVYPFRIVAKNGDTRWLEINAVQIIWEGKPATLNFLNDITEKRKLEEELLKIQKLESVGVLAGGIAHDFNNILTGILGNISLAKMYVDPKDKAFERLAEAEKASLMAKSLTQQLLTFSRGGEPILKTISTEELLKESAAFALRGSNVGCEFSIPADIWHVEVDEGQIRHVINNITINADQAMPDGGIIKVRAENITAVSYTHLTLPSKRIV